MKKTLVALAALAATSAFAQSSVVIDGYFDRGYISTNSTDNTKDSKTIGSAAGTTTIGIKVRETIGNGFSVGGSVNTDWSDLAGANQDSTATTATSAQTSGFANSQSFFDVTSAAYGTVRLGTPNNFTLTNATAVAAPAFSTAIGSSYSSSFSIANGMGTGTSGSGGIVTPQAAITNVANVGARQIRIANTVQYSSPVVLGGLTAHVGITPKNQNAGTGTDTVGANEYALRYTNGPVDAMYTSMKLTVGGTAPLNGALTAGKESTQNLLGVTYAVLPALKLNVGLGSFSSTGDTWKGSSQSFGATYTTGAWDILAQMAKVNDTSTTNIDRKMTGLGVNYNFTKTARAYFRADSTNYANTGTSADGSKLARYALGVSKSF